MTTSRNETNRWGQWELRADGTLRLRAGSDGIVVRADRGTVVVTREGDPDDHVLERGQQLVVTGRGLVVAWALRDAAVTVHPAPTRVAARLAAQAA